MICCALIDPWAYHEDNASTIVGCFQIQQQPSALSQPQPNYPNPNPHPHSSSLGSSPPPPPPPSRSRQSESSHPPLQIAAATYLQWSSPPSMASSTPSFSHPSPSLTRRERRTRGREIQRDPASASTASASRLAGAALPAAEVAQVVVFPRSSSSLCLSLPFFSQVSTPLCTSLCKEAAMDFLVEPSPEFQVRAA